MRKGKIFQLEKDEYSNQKNISISKRKIEEWKKKKNKKIKNTKAKISQKTVRPKPGLDIRD